MSEQDKRFLTELIIELRNIQYYLKKKADEAEARFGLNPDDKKDLS